jgi:hypothetical protein
MNPLVGEKSERKKSSWLMIVKVGMIYRQKKKSTIIPENVRENDLEND